MAEVLFLEHKILDGMATQVAKFAKKLKGKRVAVKAHFGEHGNLFYLRPVFLSTVVAELNKAGARPFAFDSPVAYAGGRFTAQDYISTARQNGFTSEAIGCPIVISDEGVTVETPIGEFDASKPLMDTDGMIVLSHFKGHSLATFGGAIKNLGMGGFTKASKTKLHSVTGARIANLRACTGCGSCVDVCPFGFLEVKSGKISMKRCLGCCACVIACPNHVFENKSVPLGAGLAEVIKPLIDSFSKGMILYINVLLDIVDKCDCVAQGLGEDDLPVVCPNLGILISEDIVAVDQASLDLVNKESNGKFAKLFGADQSQQTATGEKIGLGSRKYDLV